MRPATHGGGIELRSLHSQRCFVSFNGGFEQCYIGVIARNVLAARRQTVQPSDIGFDMLHFGAAQQFQEERFITGAALDDDHAVAKHTLDPG